MLISRLRLGLLIASLVASLHVAAETRFWTLTNVRFDDGSTASGYISWDDVYHAVWSLNVRVDSFGRFPAFTYISAAASTYLPFSGGNGTVLATGFTATDFDESGHVVAHDIGRVLSLFTVTPLDGSNPTVSLDLNNSYENLLEDETIRFSRRITAGSLTLIAVPPAATIVQVDEFYNSKLRHYFITADSAEKQVLDSGVYPDWARTGESFKAYAVGSDTGFPANRSISAACRYYSPALIWYDAGPAGAIVGNGYDSHFFSADAGECVSVGLKWPVEWSLETENAFQIVVPDPKTGACHFGTIPVYRLWNQRVDSNHRYTTSTSIRTQMLAAGYVSEGYGPDGVVMCAVQ